jgi:sugar diacid utilization regulator
MLSFTDWLLKESKLDFQDVLKMAKDTGIDISKFKKHQLVKGVNVETEHDKDKDTDVVKRKSDALKIAVAHLREKPNYYTLLKKVEEN